MFYTVRIIRIIKKLKIFNKFYNKLVSERFYSFNLRTVSYTHLDVYKRQQ